MNFLSWILSLVKNKSERSKKTSNISKMAICIGINDYPGTSNDLNGCVNDAKGWANLLRSYFDFKEIILLENSTATSKNVKESLQKMISKSKEGDILVFTYSGHGTTVPDRNGDEQDKRDEAICCYDGNVTDDELREIISKTPKGVSLSIISDSCHSGTVTRAMIAKQTITDEGLEIPPRPRYMPPIDISYTKSIIGKTSTTPFLSEESMIEVLLTGCKNTEYSYDAYIDNKYMGAMSANAIKIISSNPKMTWQQMFDSLRKQLPSSKYPQTPQLEASKRNKSKIIFS